MLFRLQCTFETPQPPSPQKASIPPNASAPVLTTSGRPVPSISLQQASSPPASQSSTSLASTPSKRQPTPSSAATAKKNSLTSSLTNMMASLDTSIRGPVREDDDTSSIRSDGSSDSSESYVMISQSVAESFDNALFNIQTGQAVGGARGRAHTPSSSAAR